MWLAINLICCFVHAPCYGLELINCFVRTKAEAKDEWSREAVEKRCKSEINSETWNNPFITRRINFELVAGVIFRRNFCARHSNSSRWFFHFLKLFSGKLNSLALTDNDYWERYHDGNRKLKPTEKSSSLKCFSRAGKDEAKKSIWVFAGEFSMEKFAISLLCYQPEIVLGLVQTVISICPREIISVVEFKALC